MHVRRLWVQSSNSAKHSVVEIGHEIISTAILSLPPIQVGQLSVTGERCALSTCTVNHLGLSLPRKSVVRLTDRLGMTIVVDWDVKPQNKTKQKTD